MFRDSWHSTAIRPRVHPNGFQWKDLPALTLHVCGHTKVDGHMFYDVKCALAEPGNWHSPYLSWRSLRRLCHLREGLHDPVKRSLGTAYREVFGNASFASSLHLPGTSARLNSWFQKLSGCLNRKEMSPALTAAALQLLGAPDAAEAAARSVGSPSSVAKGTDGSPEVATTSTLAASNVASMDDLDEPQDGFNPFSKDLEQEVADVDEEESHSPPLLSDSDVQSLENGAHRAEQDD